MSRVLRCIVCFLLICCILVNCSPLRADATAAGAAGVITGAATVSVSAPMVIGATLIALGLYVGVNGTDGIEAVAQSAVSHLESAGTYIKDGCVELLQTVNSAGEKAYYVAGEMMDDLRSWVFNSQSVVFSSSWNTYYTNKACSSYSEALSYASSCPAAYIGYSYSGGVERKCIIITSDSEYVSLNGGTLSIQGYGTNHSIYDGGTSWSIYSSNITYSYRNATKLATHPICTSQYDISLGYLPSSDTTLDDTTVVTFHPYLADVLETRQSGGSGGSGDDGNNNKWWLRLALGASAAAVFATTQQQQIENPSTDIQEVTWGVQFDVTDYTTEDQKKIVYVSPQTGSNPGTGTSPGTGTDPDIGDGSGDNTGSDSGSDTGGTNTGNTWTPPADHNQLAVDLTRFFPFCIPFDLFDFFTLLDADPVAPVFSWNIQDLSGQTYGLTVDLSQWDSVAQLFRRLQLFLFVCGLAAASRKYIKW